jgi:carboxypeptidase family protein/TonB-dependent receptor-like protein
MKCFSCSGVLLVLSLVLRTAPGAHAQAVTGALAGRVLTTKGDLLEGVVVNISGPGLQGDRTITSDNRGRFLFTALPPGIYLLRLQRIGYASLRVTDVTLVLGGTTSLEALRLSPQAVELSEVVVTGARPLVDPTTTATATVLDSSVLLALPMDRNFRAVMPLVPQATPSPYGDGVNVAGATGIENGYFVDGIHVTDPLDANGSLNLPYNFLREVRVTTGGYEAEYGRSQGGVVSVITSSGGNEVHGQVLGFYTGDKLRAAPRWGVGQSQLNKFSQYDVGFSIGGPIRRDRFWYYAAYNPTFENSDANFPGIATQQDSHTSHLFAGKLTGRPGLKTDFSLTLLGDPSTRDLVGSSPLFPLPASVSDPRAVLGRLQEGGTAVALQVRHQIGDRALLTASLAWLNRRQDDTPRTGPVTDLVTLARLDDHVTNSASGDYGTSNTSQAVRSSGQLSMTLLRGGHAVKLGVEYEDNGIRLNLRLSNVSKDTIRDTAGALDTIYGWFRGEARVHAHNYVPTVYLQDSWALSERLRLNLGLRWEGQFIAGDTGVARRFAAEWAPRLGVVFQPGALGFHKVYASFGRFYEEIPLLPLVGWVGFSSQGFTTYSQDPLVDSSGGIGQGGSFIGEPPDRSTRGQYYDEWTAGYEHRLGRAYRVGLRATYRTLRWVVEDAAKDPAAPFIVGNPGRGALAYLPRARREYTALELSLVREGDDPLAFLASYVLSRNWGNYTGLFATDLLVAGPNGGPQFDFPEQSVNATGLLPNDRTHVAKFAGSYRFAFGLTVGTSALVASGAPLSEYGTGPFPPYWTFIRPRGTAGRTPVTWNLDLRLGYAIPIFRGTRLHPRVQLDVFNVGDTRRPLTYDQRHYLTADQLGVNPNYLAVTQYQAPLRARLGFVLNF